MAESVFPYLNNLEKIVYSWLAKHDIPFQAQKRMFGVMELGSATVDFILSNRQIALRCNGGYWHAGLTADARDRLGREKLIEAGYVVVDCWEDDLMRRLDATMELAIQGQEMIK